MDAAKYKRGRACGYCKSVKKQCDGGRPCARCIAMSREASCCNVQVVASSLKVVEPAVIEGSRVRLRVSQRIPFVKDGGSAPQQNDVYSQYPLEWPIHCPMLREVMPTSNLNGSIQIVNTAEMIQSALSDILADRANPAGLPMLPNAGDVNVASQALSTVLIFRDVILNLLKQTERPFVDCWGPQFMENFNENMVSLSRAAAANLDALFVHITGAEPFLHSVVHASSIPTYVVRCVGLYSILHPEEMLSDMQPVSLINAAFTQAFGWTMQQITEFRVSPPTLVHPEDVMLSLYVIMAAMLAGTTPEQSPLTFRHAHVRFLCNDGTFARCCAVGHVIRAPNGLPLYYMLQLVRLEEALRLMHQAGTGNV